MDQMSRFDLLDAISHRLDIYELLLESEIDDERWLAFLRKTEHALDKLTLLAPEEAERRRFDKVGLTKAHQALIDCLPFVQHGFAALALHWPQGLKLPARPFRKPK